MKNWKYLNLLYCFLQSAIIQWRVLLSQPQKLDPFLIPWLIPIDEVSKIVSNDAPNNSQQSQKNENNTSELFREK